MRRFRWLVFVGDSDTRGLVLALLQVLAPPPSLEAQLQQYGLTTKLELYVNDAGFERCWYAVTVKKIVSASPLLLSLEYT